MTLGVRYAGDGLHVDMAVTDDAGDPVILTGATVVVRAERFGVIVDADVVSITDAEGGLVDSLFTTGLPAGVWKIQARATIGGLPYTFVSDYVTIDESLFGD